MVGQASRLSPVVANLGWLFNNAEQARLEILISNGASSATTIFICENQRPINLYQFDVKDRVIISPTVFTALSAYVARGFSLANH